MPTEEDWIEKPMQRLTRLERSLNRGIEDQAELRHEVSSLRKAVEGIQDTLHIMASDEIADLKHKAELPKRILYAVLLPVIIAVVTAIVGALVSGAHF